jgi:hypothetical protein
MCDAQHITYCQPVFAHHDGDDVLEDLEGARQHGRCIRVEHRRLEGQRAQLILAEHLMQQQQTEKQVIITSQ